MPQDKRKQDASQDSLWSRLGRGLRGGIEKGKRLGRLGLLKVDLEKARSEQRHKHEEIGRVAVRCLRDPDVRALDADEPAVKHLFEDLAAIEKMIAETEEEMARVRETGEDDEAETS